MPSKALTQTIRITRRCLHARIRDITCVVAGVILASCCMLFLHPLLLDNCSESLCEVPTTLATTTVLHPSVKLLVVSQNVNTSSHSPQNSTTLPLIYIITPTYKRVTQRADLVRLCQTLMLVKSVVWVLVEDSSQYSPAVVSLLNDCPVPSVHLKEPTTSFVSRKKGGGGHRGVDQRNTGLKWIRENADPTKRGVVYFGDDDNAYDIRLFEEMRYTKVVSVWPVAFVGMLKYEAPKCSDGKVIGWHVSFRPDRKFPLDMAAFAINLSLIMGKPNLYISPGSAAGMLENDFLTEMGVSVDELEGRANNCKSVYVWHVKTEIPKFPLEKKNRGDADVII